MELTDQGWIHELGPGRATLARRTGAICLGTCCSKNVWRKPDEAHPHDVDRPPGLPRGLGGGRKARAQAAMGAAFFSKKRWWAGFIPGGRRPIRPAGTTEISANHDQTVRAAGGRCHQRHPRRPAVDFTWALEPRPPRPCAAAGGGSDTDFSLIRRRRPGVGTPIARQRCRSSYRAIVRQELQTLESAGHAGAREPRWVLMRCETQPDVEDSFNASTGRLALQFSNMSVV